MVRESQERLLQKLNVELVFRSDYWGRNKEFLKQEEALEMKLIGKLVFYDMNSDLCFFMPRRVFLGSSDHARSQDN